MATNGGTSTTINLSDSWGSTLAGVFVSLVFYGINILQTYVACAFYSATLHHCLLMQVPLLRTVSSNVNCALPNVLTEFSCTEDTIKLKLLVGYHLSMADTLLRFLGGLGIRFRHAPYIAYICRR